MTQELPEGTVTILFTDAVGSTELTIRLGDDAARDVLGARDELMRQEIERHRGLEVKGTGDGLMVAFTSARRAIACAVDSAYTGEKDQALAILQQHRSNLPAAGSPASGAARCFSWRSLKGSRSSANGGRRLSCTSWSWMLSIPAPS